MAFKAKDVEYDVGLRKNYCTTHSYLHALILKIQQILQPRKLNKWPHPFLILPTQKSVK